MLGFQMKYLKHILTLCFHMPDQDGFHVVFKIDGGSGRLNIQMLAELRCHGIYLFPGVQNTTHITQETDQYYGLFKSKLHKNLETLTSWHAADYHLKLSMHEANPALHPNPPLPSLSREYNLSW